MRVWILQTGEPIPGDLNGLRPMRAANLSELLIESGHEVTLWTSNFDHMTKKFRSNSCDRIEIDSSLTIRLIPSRGYSKHIGLGRLIDHLQMAINLKKFLRTEMKPDVAFIGYPPIEVAFVMSNWLRKRHVPFMVDVKDTWPDNFKQMFPRSFSLLADFIFLPFSITAKQIFRNATSLASTTHEFLSWCIEYSNRKETRYDTVTPLTAKPYVWKNDEKIIANKWLADKKIATSGETVITFIGTLSRVFDFNQVIQAARDFPSVQFVIAGDGPQYNDLLDKTREIHNILLLGWVDTLKSKALMECAKFTLAPIKDLDDFKRNIPNKFYDSLANGVPILSSIQGAGKDFLEINEIGIWYSPFSNDALSLAIKKYLENSMIQRTFAKNARILYQENYSYKTVYGKLVTILENLRDEKE